MIKINIKDLVGKNALNYEKAEILYNSLLDNISLDSVELDFTGVLVASPFLNGSIGLLLKRYDIIYLQKNIKFTALSDNDKNILNLVIGNSITYFRNNMKELESQLQNYITNTMEFDVAYDISHIKRVVKTAKEIALKENADLNIVIPACWLHDCVNVDKNSKDRNLGSKFSADKAIEFLTSINYPKEYLEAIHHAIHSHSYSANIETKTLEAKVVQDADRIDALGALGLSRCLMYSASKNRPLYDKNDPFAENRELDDNNSAIDHFYTKLQTLPSTMKTTTGKEIADFRWQYIEDFLSQLKSEIV
jgi:uncharacterized protein